MKHLGRTNLNTMAMQMRRRRILKLNMAPMIDCVFLLLIFFMVSTTFTPMRGIRVQLPPPTPDFQDHKPNSVVIKIDNPIAGDIDGTMLLDGNIVQYDEMFTLLLNAFAEDKTSLIIQAGRDVFHEQIVRVVDAAKEAGIDNINFAVAAR